MIRLAGFFSGIGGLELGLEAALSAETVFQCERDPYATAVLERHWPGVQRHDDITQLEGADIPDADIWCGGFPCQDISLAGKGAGLDGDRSGLWWEWLRLIREVGPRFLVVENVAAFAVRGLDRVLGALADSGYDAEWSRLSAADVGAPHLRRRLFIIAWRNASHTLGHALRVEPVAEQRCGSQAEPGHDGQAGLVADADQVGRHGGAGVLGEGRRTESANGGPFVADANGRGQQEREEQHLPPQVGPAVGTEGRSHAGGCGDDSAHWPLGSPSGQGLEKRRGSEGQRAHETVTRTGWWAAEPDVVRVAHGVPKRVDRLRCLGNAVVPQCAYVVGLRLRELMAEPPC